MELKVTTFNAEWMYSFFEKDKAILLDEFPGGRLGNIPLEPIEDVKGLCKRIGSMFASIKAD